MLSINDFIAKAADLYDADLHAFASKSARKDAQGYLSRAYEELRRADHTAIIDKLNAEGLTDMSPESARWDEIERREMPMNLCHYRTEKHADRWLSALRCEVAGQLVSLYYSYKSAEILPKAVSAQAELKREERKAAAAVKDNGFRVGGLNNQSHFCQNEQGTQWFRLDWYRNGNRVAFQAVQHYIGECMKVWEAAGSPDQSDWTFRQIEEFYREVA